MLDRVGSADSVGSTCTTPHISLVFKPIFDLLADCAKWMVVRVPLLVDLKIKILTLTCTPLHQGLGQFEITVRFIKFIYGMQDRVGSTYTPLNQDLGHYKIIVRFI